MRKANSLTAEILQSNKDLERERVRPNIIFDLITDEKQMVYAELRNEGLSSAKNVKLAISPELNSKNRNNLPCTFTDHKISLMAPGRQLRDFIDVGYIFFETYKEPKFNYSITYSSFDGTNYLEEATIDLTYLKTLIKITPTSVGKEVRKIHKEIDDLNKTLVKLWHTPLKIKKYEDEKNLE